MADIDKFIDSIPLNIKNSSQSSIKLILKEEPRDDLICSKTDNRYKIINISINIKKKRYRRKDQ